MKHLKGFFNGQKCCLILSLVVMAALLVPNIVYADGNKAKVSENPPEISVNRSQLNYGAIVEGGSTSSATPYQSLLINNSGGGTLHWKVTNDNDDWLICTPKYGVNSGEVKVYVAPCSLSSGSYNGTITVQDEYNPTVTPQTVSVDLEVKSPSQDHPPFGSFATPLHNSHVSSSIPVTGWALDDVEVDNVKVYNGSDYVGDAQFVEGARPDVAQAYPDYPLNYRAGWGYMMLTNFLPNGGNGTYHITAIATDSEGNQTSLGTKTIICDNEHAVKPFGAIDTPPQGGSVSGSGYYNWGWALTPQPNHIPTDGSTINVWVSGVNKGHVKKYNVYREDIANLFPDYSNSDGAAGLFEFDTTGYADGVYTIQWTATDSANNTDGIGSRYFTIRNTDRKANPGSQNHKRPPINIGNLNNLPLNHFTPVEMRKGFNRGSEARELYPDNNGVINIRMKELDRIELKVSSGLDTQISGYMLVGDQIRDLPIGSTLDTVNGKFYWMPGLAFLGKYHLVFIENSPAGEMRKDVIVNIVSRFE